MHLQSILRQGRQFAKLRAFTSCTLMPVFIVVALIFGALKLHAQTVTATNPAAGPTSATPGDEINKDLPHWMRFTFRCLGAPLAPVGAICSGGNSSSKTPMAWEAPTHGYLPPIVSRHPG